MRAEARLAPARESVGDYDWGGAGGTASWVDPKQEMFSVYMMQAPKFVARHVYAAIAE